MRLFLPAIVPAGPSAVPAVVRWAAALGFADRFPADFDPAAGLVCCWDCGLADWRFDGLLNLFRGLLLGLMGLGQSCFEDLHRPSVDFLSPAAFDRSTAQGWTAGLTANPAERLILHLLHLIECPDRFTVSCDCLFGDLLFLAETTAVAGFPEPDSPAAA